MHIKFALAASLLALAPAAAFAQDGDGNAPAGSKLDGDYLVVGAGGIYGPSYEGSDDQVFSPIPIVQGRIGGVEINPRAGGIGLDIIPDDKDAKVGLQFGPVVSYTGNRHRQIKDPVVRASGKLKEAIDVGFNAGFTVYDLLSDYDSLTFSADAKWNVNKAHKGTVITPQVSYATPLSKGSLLVVGANLKHVDDDYADYYYSVNPGQSAATGGILPVYQAKGGWVGYGGSALLAYDLDGDLTNGGLSLFAIGNYTRLTGDAKRTPFTSLRGSANQWTVGGGVAYTF